MREKEFKGIRSEDFEEEVEEDETQHDYNSEKHQSRLIKTFGKLYKSNILTDVTLVTEDHITIQAHKIVLCAGSEFFNDFLVGSSCGSNTLMYLRGVSESILRPLLEFLYLGETRVPQKSFDDFMNIANDLKISDIGKDDKKEAQLLENDIKTEDITNDINEDPSNVEPEPDSTGYDSFGQPVFHQEDKPRKKYTYNKTSEWANKTSECHFCGKVMKASSLGLHIRSLHEKTFKFKCDHCPFEATRKDKIKDHLMQVHSIGYKFICDFSGCNFKTIRPSKLSIHKYKCHFLDEGETANVELAETRKVSDKIETSGTNDKYKCDLPECAFIASNPGELMEHKFSRHRS